MIGKDIVEFIQKNNLEEKEMDIDGFGNIRFEVSSTKIGEVDKHNHPLVLVKELIFNPYKNTVKEHYYEDIDWNMVEF